MAIPKLPKHTCPMIDKLKGAIERAFSLSDGEYPDDEESLKSLLRDIRYELSGGADALEDIRSANAQLRECAEGYMHRCDELESQV